MAEPLRNDEPLSSMRFPESPGSSTLNATRSAAEPVALIPDTLPDRPLGAWPEGVRGTEERRLNNAGERVGSALGKVVSQTREFGGIVQDRVSELKRKFRVIAGRRSAQVKNRASELSDEAQHRASELADEARHQARMWEFRARLYARRSPFQFIAGAAATGFAIGFLLRMWRDE
jgi:ElaB/YqjD/DUF883 family membrane-anchored ribosome-binding protein